MAGGYIPLPAYRAQSPFDFTGLNEGIDEYNKKVEKNRLLREAQQIGAAIDPGTATQTPQNPLLAPSNVPASPAQASAAAAGLDFPTSGADYSPAIKSIESSGGNYRAVGPITRTGDRAYGAHQVMGENIPVWTKEVLGQSLTPQQYLDNPDAQEKVFRAKFGQFVKQTGNPQDAASMWFTGKPLAQGANRRDILGTTGTQYVNNFNANLGGAQAAQAQAAPTPSGPNYRKAAAKAFEFGNVALGTQLLQQQSELDNQAYTRSHQAQQEATAQQQWQAGHGLQVAQNTRAEATAGREAQTFADAQEKALGQQFGAIAQTIVSEPDPAQRLMKWQSLVAADPRIALNLRKYGVDPADPDAGSKLLIAEAMGITGGVETGTTPQYYNVNGDVKMGVVTKKGDFKPVPVPGQILPNVKLADQGTQFTPVGPGGVKMGEVLPKDVAGEARQKEGGKLSADAQAALPAAKTSVDDAVRLVDKLRTHPGLDVATGLSSVADPRNYTPGSDAYNFNVLNKQEVSKTFMAAREGLKGAGQVTDFEGNKGQDAIGRLNTAQSKPAYLEALDDVERMMKSSYSDLEKKAGMFQPAKGAAAPAQSNSAVKKMTDDELRKALGL